RQLDEAALGDVHVVPMLDVEINQNVAVEPVDRDGDENEHVRHDEQVFKEVFRHAWSFSSLSSISGPEYSPAIPAVSSQKLRGRRTRHAPWGNSVRLSTSASPW